MRDALPVILLFVPIALVLLLHRRPRQGALSALRTPTRPPAPARLVPLEVRGGIRGCGQPPSTPPVRPSDAATSARPYPRCARDSDWCDGRLCRERGIDCPHADE